MTASGSASVTHSTTIMARMAAELCAGAGIIHRAASSTSSRTGATNRPNVRRRRLNSSSDGEIGLYRIRRPREPCASSLAHGPEHVASANTIRPSR